MSLFSIDRVCWLTEYWLTSILGCFCLPLSNVVFFTHSAIAWWNAVIADLDFFFWGLVKCCACDNPQDWTKETQIKLFFLNPHSFNLSVQLDYTQDAIWNILIMYNEDTIYSERSTLLQSNIHITGIQDLSETDTSIQNTVATFSDGQVNVLSNSPFFLQTCSCKNKQVGRTILICIIIKMYLLFPCQEKNETKVWFNATSFKTLVPAVYRTHRTWEILLNCTTKKGGLPPWNWRTASSAVHYRARITPADALPLCSMLS